MRRDLWMILILGCLLILLLEAPAALSSVSAELDSPTMQMRAGEVQAAEKTSETAARPYEESPVTPTRREESAPTGRNGLGT